MPATIKVLSVEDDDDDANLLTFALEQTPDRAYELRRARSLAQMHGILSSFRPDIVLLDLNLPDSRGLDTVRSAVLASHDAPILVLTGSMGDEAGTGAVEAGAQDFLPKSEMMAPVLKRSIDFAIQRKGMVRAAELRAATDALTGLSNRAAFSRALDQAAARADRHAAGFALAFIDLDGFKAINDTHGHAAGDEVLVMVAARARGMARSSDHVCRLGGDEFVILFDSVTVEDHARRAAARYAAAIEEPILLSNGLEVRVGVSMGLALCPADGKTASELVQVADQRMYASKMERKRPRRKDQAVS